VKEFGIHIDYGFYVDSMERKSIAQLSGMLPGDVIIEVDDNRVEKFEDIVELMKYNKAGDVVKIKVKRKKEEKEIKVKLRKGL